MSIFDKIPSSFEIFHKFIFILFSDCFYIEITIRYLLNIIISLTPLHKNFLLYQIQNKYYLFLK